VRIRKHPEGRLRRFRAVVSKLRMLRHTLNVMAAPERFSRIPRYQEHILRGGYRYCSALQVLFQTQPEPQMAVLSRIFRSLASAENAMNALREAGFDREALSLVSQQDEAGPVEGNFVIGNGREDPTLGSAPTPESGGESDNPYQRNFGDQAGDGIFILTLQAEEAQHGRAAEIMGQCGAIDVDELTAMRSTSSG